MVDVPVMPIQALVMANESLAVAKRGPIEVVQRLFPNGLPITQENVQLLLDNGWTIPSLLSCHLPITGAFTFEGYQAWYRDGKLHRVDGPAVIHANGLQAWWRDGKRHRDGGPALTWSDGSQFWYRDGNLHRVDGPAVTFADGSQYWYRDGKRHREEEPAFICANGRREWWLDGKLTCVAEMSTKGEPGYAIWNDLPGGRRHPARSPDIAGLSGGTP